MLSEREAKRVLKFLCKRWVQRMVNSARKLWPIYVRWPTEYHVKMIRAAKTEEDGSRSIQAVVTTRSLHCEPKWKRWLSNTLTFNDGKKIIFLDKCTGRAKRAAVVEKVFESAKDADVKLGSWSAVFVDRGESLEEVLVKGDLEDV